MFKEAGNRAEIKSMNVRMYYFIKKLFNYIQQTETKMYIFENLVPPGLA